MLDTGLIASGIAIVAVLYTTTRFALPATLEPGDVFDRLALPAIAGLLVGRAVGASLDDPASLRTLRAFLVIRGGVEFWPGTLAMVVFLAVGIRRRRGAVIYELAALIPFVLWGYATFEATCVARDGCYGPVSAIGLVPGGLQTRMLPLGLIAGAVVAALGFVVHRVWSWSPVTKLLVAVGGVAAVRAVASIWLPRLGTGLTRQHRESIGVASVVLVLGAVLWARSAFQRHRRSGLADRIEASEAVSVAGRKATP